MTKSIDNMIDTKLRYLRQKVLLTSTGIPEVDEAIKEAFLRDQGRGRGANEMWRPHVKIIMAWMLEKDAKDEQEKAKKQRDKYALFETAKGGEA